MPGAVPRYGQGVVRSVLHRLEIPQVEKTIKVDAVSEYLTTDVLDDFLNILLLSNMRIRS